ncbi:MAG TPA: xanthine dehydrogenase family protein subunit M [Pyrinomonadaceae bacterium]|nr:xanthine dehydrogenase family protein subunit M [Pyrinomonadaceae bacterium]
MRAYLPDYHLRAPKTLSDALELLAREPGVWRAFAGGTDLMVLLEFGALKHKNFLSVRHLPELGGIEVTPEHVTLGALTTYTQIQRNETMRREFPLLCAAARETGGIAIQNRGTLGGNIINASPAADSPPALIVYDAMLEFVSTRGARVVPYHKFHTGYKQMDMRADELLRCIRLPRATGNLQTYYRKVGTRKAQAISKICFAAGARLASDGRITDARLGLGSVAPTVVRCTHTEDVLRDQTPDEATIKAACETLAQEITPIDDMRSTAQYRARVAANLLADFLSTLKTDGGASDIAPERI